MYTKEQLIHEGVKVLKVSYYLIIFLAIRVLMEIGLIIVPTTTKTITYDAQGKKGTESFTTTYRFFGPHS